MIVRCPECSTGFKLPDEQVTEKGVKLRCSKCSHVFRIRLADDGDTEFFYNDGDREQNEALAAAGGQASDDADDADDSEAPASDAGDDEWAEGESTKLGKPMAPPESQGDDAEVDAAKASQTQFGMPSSKKEASDDKRKPSKSASSNYNPFPHANLDLKPSKESALGSDSATSTDAPAESAQPAQSEAASSPQEEDLDWGDEATRVEDAFDGAFDEDAEEDDPFDDAFADEDASDSGAQAAEAAQAPQDAHVAQAPQEAAAPSASAPAVSTPADSVASAPADPATPAPAEPATPASAEPVTSAASDPAAAAQAAAAGAQAGAQPAVQTPKSAQPEKDSEFWAQKNSAYSPEDMVDPSFGQDGPAFDPDQGVVDNKPAASQAAAGPPAGVTASPAQAARSVQASPPQASQPQAGRPNASAKTTSRQNQSVQNDGGWEVDMIDDPIAPHTVGGSGLQKFANLVLIALIVGVGFLAVVAGLTGGILDLNRFPHMLEVAFEGAEFAPREEWVEKSAPAPAPAPEDPVRFEGVFATPTSVGKSDQVILVRGNAQNIADVDYSDVIVRGILYDKNERVIAQTTAPLGARVLPSQLAEAGSADAAKGLLPENAKLLSSQSTEPFSLIFTNLPPKVFEAQDVIYRVEIADKKSTADEAAAAATN